MQHDHQLSVIVHTSFLVLKEMISNPCVCWTKLKIFLQAFINNESVHLQISQSYECFIREQQIPNYFLSFFFFLVRRYEMTNSFQMTGKVNTIKHTTLTCLI